MSDATSTARLTVVLVHGAFADSSSWEGVIERLQADGVQVTAPPNPLRGISQDSAYTASFMKHVPGPVLAGGWCALACRQAIASSSVTSPSLCEGGARK